MSKETNELIRHFGRRIVQTQKNASYAMDPIKIVVSRAAEDSADYIEQNLGAAMLFHDKKSTRSYAMRNRSLPHALHLEFGVFKAESINHMSGLDPEAEFHGFDSFEGLQEDWAGYHMAKGHFNLEGRLPKVNDNVTLHKGWFDQTLPQFLDSTSCQIGFLHVDCDTYPSANYVLETLADRITVGTVVLFDEYLGYAGRRQGEYLAWQQWVKKHNATYEYLAFAPMQTLVKVTKIG
jgi:hypothetical protein